MSGGTERGAASGEKGGVEITVDGLVCRYGRGGEAVAALDGLDLVVPRGRVTAVVGPSGAGKSTLLRAVAGLAAPAAGDVRFDGRSVVALAPEKRRLGVVFQSYALFPHLTVADNVAFAARVQGAGRRAARRGVGEVLARLGIAHLAGRLPQQLSGGERQRVALARALAAEPRALLLDEPLAALDARLRLALRAELAERLRAAGLTAVYVTHDQQEAMALGDRVAVLAAGRLEQVGTPEALYRRPATPFVASFFGEASFLAVVWDAAARRLTGPAGVLDVDAATASRFDGLARGRLMVRPEGFRPSAGGPIVGRVASAVFLGDRRRLTVEAIGVGKPLLVDLPASQPVAVGEPLRLAVDWSAAALLPGDEAESDRERRGPG